MAVLANSTPVPSANPASALLARLGRGGLEDLIASAIDLLDQVDGDPDLETYDVDLEDDDPIGVADEDGVNIHIPWDMVQFHAEQEATIPGAWRPDQTAGPLPIDADAEPDALPSRSHPCRPMRQDRALRLPLVPRSDRIPAPGGSVMPQALNTDRRGMLATTFASVAAVGALIPVATSGAALTLKTPQIGWERVKAAYLTAEEAISTHDHGDLTGASPAACKRADDEFSAVCTHRDNTVVALMEYPATCVGMVAYKVALIIDDERWECTTFEREMAGVLADLRRLERMV